MAARNALYEFGSFPLAAYGVVASWRRPLDPSSASRLAPSVIVMQASHTDGGVFEPAADVTVSGEEALRRLRTAIDEALGEASGSAA